MVSDKDSYQKYPNEQFNKLCNAALKKKLEVTLAIDGQKHLFIEVQDKKGKLSGVAEQVKDSESVDKAAVRVYKRLVKEGKVE